jgi:hypothetical protein
MNFEDNSLLNRLALVKQLYKHGAEHSRSTATIDKIVAVISLDHAVEMLLEGVVQAFPEPQSFAGPSHLYFGDPERLRTQTFQVERAGFFRLWDQVTAICQELPEPQPLILKAEMRSLHLARNDAQHSIKVPSSEFLSEMLSATRTFLDHLLSLAFDITLRQVSEALLVRTPVVRQALEMAHNALVDDDRLLFSGLLRLAFTLAQAGAIQGVQVGRFLNVEPPATLLQDALDEADADSGLAKSLANLQDYLVHLHAELTSLSLELGLGLDRQQFSRFALLTPAVPFIEPDGFLRWLDSGQNLAYLDSQLTPDVCLWMQDYAVETIMGWEANGLATGIMQRMDVKQAADDLVALIEAKRRRHGDKELIPAPVGAGVAGS